MDFTVVAGCIVAFAAVAVEIGSVGILAVAAADYYSLHCFLPYDC